MVPIVFFFFLLWHVVVKSTQVLDSESIGFEARLYAW